MKTILLYGALGKKFGKKHTLDVKNPAEAIRALSVVIKGFKKYMIGDKVSGYTVFVGSEDIYLDEIGKPTSDEEVIKIVPIITGSGNNAKIIIGVILVAVASYASGGTATKEASTAFFSWATVGQIGTLLIIQGVAGIMFEPSVEDVELPEDNPNYVFDGVVNTTRQGNAVPVGYGQLRVGSQVISAGLTVDDAGTNLFKPTPVGSRL